MQHYINWKVLNMQDQKVPTEFEFSLGLRMDSVVFVILLSDGLIHPVTLIINSISKLFVSMRIIFRP